MASNFKRTPFTLAVDTPPLFQCVCVCCQQTCVHTHHRAVPPCSLTRKDHSGSVSDNGRRACWSPPLPPGTPQARRGDHRGPSHPPSTDEKAQSSQRGQHGQLPGTSQVGREGVEGRGGREGEGRGYGGGGGVEGRRGERVEGRVCMSPVGKYPLTCLHTCYYGNSPYLLC